VLTFPAVSGVAGFQFVGGWYGQRPTNNKTGVVDESYPPNSGSLFTPQEQQEMGVQATCRDAYMQAIFCA